MARGDVVIARRDIGGQRPQRIERRLVADLELPVHILLDLVHRHMAGAFDHHLHIVLLRDAVEFAQRVEFGELRGVIGVGGRAGAQAVAQRERHVILLQEFADVLEMRVEEILLVMRQAPFGQDRAAAGDDAGDALGRQRNMRQPHAGMDGEIIHALLALLDQRVAIDFPGQFLGDAADFLQRLIDRHGADRHRRIADDPFADGVDVAAGGQVHHRVGAPADRPDQLFHFLGHAGGHGAVADIGVDLGEEIAADDHRLGFGMVDVGGNDGAAAGDLVAHEFRRDLDRGWRRRSCCRRPARCGPDFRARR